MGILLTPRGEEYRAAPVEIADAVALWGRNRGLQAKLVWKPAVRPPCFAVEIELKPDDPRMKMYREGRLEEKPVEFVPLFYKEYDEFGGSKFVASDIEQMGATGVVNLLEQGDLMTGRGDAKNLLDACRKVQESNEQRRKQLKRDILAACADRTRDHRRAILGNPLVPVTSDTK